MSNEDVSLTLGPVGPRGPCGPLTPMAPWGKRQKVSNKRLHHISIWHKEYLCMCVLLCSLVCLCSISLSLLTLQSVVRYKYIVFNWIKLWLCNDGNRPLLHLRLFLLLLGWRTHKLFCHWPVVLYHTNSSVLMQVLFDAALYNLDCNISYKTQ